VNPITFEAIREANASPLLADVPPDQDAREFELHFDANIALDILTTREPNAQGAIARYLSKFGEGIQQVEYRCSNVEAATALLKKKFGVDSVYPQTRPGADNTRINFFLARTLGGEKVLIELYEK
jgi:methylmalonyl-CoA/ethylmalonyl-CoA epimerase